MPIRDFLRKIGSKPLVVKLTSGLGIRGLLRWGYRYFFAPQGGKHEICVEGRHAKFHIYSEFSVEVLNDLCGERPMLEHLMRRLAPGDCFYDIGAATGLYAIFLAQVVGQKGSVIAFEPQSDPCERLLENVKLNKLTNVQAFQVALSDQDGSAILQIADVAGAGRIVGSSEHSPLPQEHVRIVQGDRFIQSRGLRVPRALKIDVEGHEYSVLAGLSKTLSQPSCELVCCEVHPRFLPGGLKADDVLALLRSMGFTEIESHSRADDLHVWASRHA